MDMPHVPGTSIAQPQENLCGWVGTEKTVLKVPILILPQQALSANQQNLSTALMARYITTSQGRVNYRHHHRFKRKKLKILVEIRYAHHRTYPAISNAIANIFIINLGIMKK
jgi:hypothetical protein